MIDDVIDPRETRPVIIGALGDGGGQARRAAVEAAWCRAGLSGPRLRLNINCGIEEGVRAAAATTSVVSTPV